MDDMDSSNDECIWKVYYQLFLDDRSLQLAQTQSRKLHTLSVSLQSWHDSKYGRFLRICDQETLEWVREIWNSYCTMDLNEAERTSYNQRFKSGIQQAVTLRDRLLGGGSGQDISGFRSASPVGLESLEDLPNLFRQFWDDAVTDGGRDSPHPNPLFAPSSSDSFTLHYGTQPLLGFHLATAYVPLRSGSPLHLESFRHLNTHKVVRAARLQFRAWGDSFRRSAGQSLTLRYFAGEALAFCHTLQHMRLTGDGISANWYRAPYHPRPLVLDGEDYRGTRNAPLSFNVIDTSNLADHVGAINLLVATSPLLDMSLSATLYTESLVKRQQNQREFIDEFLCGHFVSVSILLGLFPIEYWTNASAISNADEQLLKVIQQGTGDTDRPSQMHNRLAWKRPASAFTGKFQTSAMLPVHFDETELALIFQQIYLNMFEHEQLSQLFSRFDRLTLHNRSLPRYHRGSLASFLCLVKKRVAVDWEKVMDFFLDLVANDSNLPMGRHYIQELHLQLHIFGVYSAPLLKSPSTRSGGTHASTTDLRAWKDMPSVVCISLKVPRKRLGVFTELPKADIGTPPVHGILEASRDFAGEPWQNIFAVVALAFGEATMSGSRSDDDFRLEIVEDRRGWRGSSPLFVSFCVPSWVVLLQPQDATVALGVQSTPQSIITFSKALGVEMMVYETTLGNEENVYISKHRPNQSGHASVCAFEDGDVSAHAPSDEAVLTKITADIDRGTARISTMTGRVTAVSDDVKFNLRNGASVETVQISPCTIAVTIGKSPCQYYLHFPAPVLRSRSKCRIARKSFYVEVVAPIPGPVDKESFPHFMYPLFMTGADPVAWNMPRLNLECLPILDTAKTKDLQWLIMHASLMFSNRERKIREQTPNSKAGIHDVRVNFKDSLFCMFMSFSGLQGRRARAFGISNPTAGGVHILVLVSCLRLDIANHTVVLDAAVLPLTDLLMPRITRFLKALTDVGIYAINVDDDEMRLWKELIPALVERCRQWEHGPNCEYRTRSRIPLSVQNGQTPICSCGGGQLPANFLFDLAHFDSVSRYTTRAAISPSFALPFVEPAGELLGSEARGLFNGDRCKACGKGKSSSGTSLLRCARCREAKYCSVECQRANWKEHKKRCTK